MITCYILYVRVSSEQDRDIYIYKILYVRVTSEQDRDIYTKDISNLKKKIHLNIYLLFIFSRNTFLKTCIYCKHVKK